jgi:predicted patatin/cPLA2 family phospholipase
VSYFVQWRIGVIVMKKYNNKVALVLEGGALRSVYTAGVLDVFMEKDLYLDYVVGVSAGALTGANYISRQPGRSALFNIEHRYDSRYIGLKHLLFEGSIFNFDFLFKEAANSIWRYDVNRLKNTNQRFLIETTNCLSGDTVFFEEYEYNALTEALRASSSLPFLSRIPYINGAPYIDGGIANTVPIEKAISDGYKKIIVILTRKKGYKAKNNKIFVDLCRLYYRKYPKIIQLMENAGQRNNEKMLLLDKLEKEGKILIIRPSTGLKVGRVERSTDKLRLLYLEGKEDARNAFSKILEYIDSIEY